MSLALAPEPGAGRNSAATRSPKPLHSSITSGAGSLSSCQPTALKLRLTVAPMRVLPSAAAGQVGPSFHFTNRLAGDIKPSARSVKTYLELRKWPVGQMTLLRPPAAGGRGARPTARGVGQLDSDV